jgi:hypothetical protein
VTEIYVKGATPGSTLIVNIDGRSVSITETLDGELVPLSELQIVDRPGPGTRTVELPPLPPGMVYSGGVVDTKES